MKCPLRLLVVLALAVFTSTAGCTEGPKGDKGDGEYSWGLPERIDSEGGAGEPELAVSVAGSAVAVWVEWDGAVWANRFTPGVGWAEAERINGTSETYATDPDVAIDPGGNAIAVWQAGGTPAMIMVSRYTPDGGWETAAPIDLAADPDGYAAYPYVAMDPSGDAIAMWQQSVTAETQVVASRFSPGKGWEPLQRIDAESTGYPYEPRGVAMDPSGNAIAIWTGDDQQGGTVFANHYTPEGGWGAPEAIDDPEYSWAEGPELAMDGSGNGIVVWRQDYQEPDWSSLITTNHFTPTAGWGTAGPIENSLTYSLEPHVAMNDNGTAMVVWLGSAHGAEPTSGIWSLRYTPTDGWEAEPVLVEPLGDSSTSQSYPRVAVDPFGNALVVWRAYGGNEDQIWSSHYTPAEGWDTPVMLSFTGLSWGKGYHPQVGIDGSGKGTSVWSESGRDSMVVANRYGDAPVEDHTPIWQAICDATCARASECSLDDAECASECMDELRAMPCDPNEGALDLCVEELEDWSCQDIEHGYLPYSCARACVGDRLCEQRTCDDENTCTDDHCDPADGMCFTIPVADGTSCGPGGSCTDGRCIAEFPCTEQGIVDAVATGGGPHTFDCNGPKTVTTSATIVIDRSVVLNGEGNLTVDGGDRHTVFQLWPDGNIPGQPYSVELHQMTITGGRGRNGGIMNASTLRLLNCTVSGNEGEQRGGGIDNTGTLALDDSNVSGNRADRGGGIANGGTATINNSIVRDNEASREGEGGGIQNGATLTINGSTISGNVAAGSRGGGISNSGTLTINDSTISNNTGSGYAGGGGIYNAGDFDERGTATLNNTIVSGNASNEGGGILNRGDMRLVDCTISENEATYTGAGISNGGTMTVNGSTISANVGEGPPEPEPEPFSASGGGFHNAGTLTLINSTLSGNVVDGSGAAILNTQYATLTITSCTLSGNTSAWDNGITGGAMSVRNTIIDGDCRNVSTDSEGGNIESSSDTCGLGEAGDQTGVPAIELNLGALANNGGPTDTHEVRAGSIAIDVVAEQRCVDPQGNPLSRDQRGEERPQGSACDVGSFERLQP
jgi:hypothetical protein